MFSKVLSKYWLLWCSPKHCCLLTLPRSLECQCRPHRETFEQFFSFFSFFLIIFLFIVIRALINIAHLGVSMSSSSGNIWANLFLFLFCFCLFSFSYFFLYLVLLSTLLTLECQCRPHRETFERGLTKQTGLSLFHPCVVGNKNSNIFSLSKFHSVMAPLIIYTPCGFHFWCQYIWSNVGNSHRK